MQIANLDVTQSELRLIISELLNGARKTLHISPFY